MNQIPQRTAIALGALLLFVSACSTDLRPVTIPQSPTPVRTPASSPRNTPVPTDSAVPSSTPTLTPTHPPTPAAATYTASPSPTATSTDTAIPTLTSTPAPSSTPGVEMAARLDLDIRWTADVVLGVIGDEVTAKVTLSDARGVAKAGVMLEGSGKVFDFPESDGLLYTARLVSPAVPGGRCAGQPVSMSLALFRRGTNARVAGGMAVYCGAGTWSGPPVRMLRLSGSMPKK